MHPTRIHPTRIEELYDKTSKDMQVKIRELGEGALFELGITKMDTESKPSVNKNDVFTESVSPAIAALVNSEAMQDIFG